MARPLRLRLRAWPLKKELYTYQYSSVHYTILKFLAGPLKIKLFLRLPFGQFETNARQKKDIYRRKIYRYSKTERRESDRESKKDKDRERDRQTESVSSKVIER